MGDSQMNQRNKLVAVLAGLFPSWQLRTDIEGWDDEWHGCIYIQLPSGQVSFHFHDSQRDLFCHVIPADKMDEAPPPYDGHDDETKWARVATVAWIAGDMLADREELHRVLAEYRQMLNSQAIVEKARRTKLEHALANARSRDRRQRAELHRMYVERASAHR